MSPVDSLRTEAKFKKTEIGEIPMDWQTLSTIDIIKKSPGSMKIGPFGSQLKKEYFVQPGYKVYGQENVFNKDFKLGNRRIDKSRFGLLSSFQLYPGDVVITMMGTVGRCAIVPDDIDPGIMDSHLLRLDIDEERYSKELLVQLISNSSIIKKQIKQLSVGGIMEGLSSNIIKRLIFPYPPIQEQKKIAEILSAVDVSIDKKQEIIEKLKALKKGLARELLTCGIGHTKFNKTEIGEIPADWRVVQVKDVSGKPEYGYTASAIEKPVGPKFLRITDIQNGHVNWSLVPYCHFPDSMKRKYILKSGDILFARTGATTGKSFLIQDCPEAVFASYLIRITPTSKIRSQFLNFVFNSHVYWKQIRQALSGSAQGGVNATFLSKIKIPLPPVGEQELIATIMSEIDTLIEKELRQETTLANMKKGLMERLLTGKIRVS